MKTKICSICGKEKQLDLFSKNKNKKDGYTQPCKECKRIIDKKYNDANKDKRKLSSKEFKNKNPEYGKIYHQKYRKKNPDKELNRHRLYHAKKAGFNTIDEYQLSLQKKKDEVIRLKELKRIEDCILREKNKELKRIESNKKIKEKRIEDNRKLKEKRINDDQYRIMDNLRCRTRKILRIQSAKKHTKMATLIGLSGKQLVKYFNDKGWNKEEDNIDHIIPMSAFNLTNPEHQLIACYYKNLQPLHTSDNATKSNKLYSGWDILLKEICIDRDIEFQPVYEYILNKYNNKPCAL